MAKDANDNAIGFADGFISHSSLAANAQSGFKLRTGTFLTEKLVTWLLRAFGRTHRTE